MYTSWMAELAMSVEGWGSFGQLAGGTSGVLIGLLFVVVSLNRRRIAEGQILRVSAVQTLVIFLLPLASSIVLLTPGQSPWILGSELLALAVAQGLILVIIGRHKRNTGVEPSRLARLIDDSSSNLLTTSLVLIGGVTLIAGHGGGLYWLPPAVILAIISGSANAWMFLIFDPD